MKLPGPSMLVALAALGVALSSPAMSTVDRLITGADVRNGSLTGADVKKNSLTGAEIKNGSLQVADLSTGARAAFDRPGPAGPQGEPGPRGPAGPAGADASVADLVAGGDLTGTFPDPQIAPGAVGSGALADGSVTTAKLEPGAVTGDRLAGGSVSLSKLGLTDVGVVNFSMELSGNTCLRSGFAATFPAGSLVLQRVVSGSLPPEVFLPAYTVRSSGTVEVILCNISGLTAGPFVVGIGVRVLG